MARRLAANCLCIIFAAAALACGSAPVGSGSQRTAGTTDSDHVNVTSVRLNPDGTSTSKSYVITRSQAATMAQARAQAWAQRQSPGGVAVETPLIAEDPDCFPDAIEITDGTCDSFTNIICFIGQGGPLNLGNFPYGSSGNWGTHALSYFPSFEGGPSGTGEDGNLSGEAVRYSGGNWQLYGVQDNFTGGQPCTGSGIWLAATLTLTD